MKIIAWISGIVIFVLVALYVFAFTAFGNGIVAPIIEDKIKVQTGLESKFRTFVLGISDFEVLLDLDKENSIYAKGSYSLWSESLDAVYTVKLQKLENLEALVQRPLQGSLLTSGTALGDMTSLKVDGTSDLAKSETKYHLVLSALKPSSIIATIKDANVDLLLAMAGEKEYADGELDLDINFKAMKANALDGTVVLTTREGKLNSTFLSKEFDLRIPTTKFSMNLDAKLQGDAIDYSYILESNIATIKSSGNVKPTPLLVDVSYTLDVEELAVLKPVLALNMRGPLRLDGTAKGSEQNMKVEGKSDIASSNTRFSAVLKEFVPSSLHAKVEYLQIKKLLYMLKQPLYTSGLLSLDIAIDDLAEGSLDGTVASKIQNGLLNSRYLTQEYGLKTKMPYTNFTLQTNTKLDADIAQTQVNFQSSLASLKVKNAKFNLKDSSLESDFTASVTDLNRLFFLTQRELKGALKFDGVIKKAKDLELTVHSKVAGGTMDAKVFNNDVSVDLASIQTLEALEILVYPQMFRASLNGQLIYDLQSKKGNFKGDLVDGRFTENTMLSLIKQYARIDLYKENFKGDVHAVIEKEKLLASLDLVSNTSSIRTKDAKLDSKEKMIDAKIEIVANKHPISVGVKGKTSAPKVSVDAGDILKNEAKKAVGEKLDGLLKGFF